MRPESPLIRRISYLRKLGARTFNLRWTIEFSWVWIYICMSNVFQAIQLEFKGEFPIRRIHTSLSTTVNGHGAGTSWIIRWNSMLPLTIGDFHLRCIRCSLLFLALLCNFSISLASCFTMSFIWLLIYHLNTVQYAPWENWGNMSGTNEISKNCTKPLPS